MAHFTIITKNNLVIYGTLNRTFSGTGRPIYVHGLAGLVCSCLNWQRKPPITKKCLHIDNSSSLLAIYSTTIKFDPSQWCHVVRRQPVCHYAAPLLCRIKTKLVCRAGAVIVPIFIQWFYFHLIFPSFLFSRSYCYTVWSTIGIIVLSVRLPVCPCVCLHSVTLCIVALGVGVQG